MRKRPPRTAKAVLLTGGNPKVAKGDGDAPVRAYISAMPGWKRNVGKPLDEIICSNLSAAHKGVRWNSPMYGIKGQGWFEGDLDEAKLARWVRQAAAMPGWGKSWSSTSRSPSLAPIPDNGTLRGLALPLAYKSFTFRRRSVSPTIP
jgi:hypothetical protein